RTELISPARLLLLLVFTQATLGAFVVLSRRQPWVNSAHVVVGAMVLTTSLVLALRSWQVRFPRSRAAELCGVIQIPDADAQSRTLTFGVARILDPERALRTPVAWRRWP